MILFSVKQAVKLLNNIGKLVVCTLTIPARNGSKYIKITGIRISVISNLCKMCAVHRVPPQEDG